MIIHTVTSYEEDLDLLTSSVCEMGGLLSILLELLHKVIQSKDSKTLEQAREVDQRINNFDEQIEAKAESLIVLRQPVSIDLRRIIASLKSAVIIERMGDLAKNAVKRACETEHLYLEEIRTDIDKIFVILKSMLGNALDSYKELDEAKALNVCIKDGEIDELYKTILIKLQKNIYDDKSMQVNSILHAAFAVKNIERIGDYISKIAQMVLYIKTGKKLTKNQIKQITNNGSI